MPPSTISKSLASRPAGSVPPGPAATPVTEVKTTPAGAVSVKTRSKASAGPSPALVTVVEKLAASPAAAPPVRTVPIVSTGSATAKRSPGTGSAAPSTPETIAPWPSA